MAISVQAVLQEHGYTVREQDVARILAGLLPPSTAPSVAMSAEEAAFLDRHSGVKVASQKQLRELSARAAARATAEAVQALGRSEIAALLRVDPSRISHMTAQGALFAYRTGPGRLVYPDWQVHAGSVIPHLAQVLTALPANAHPVAVRTFMTTPDDDLRVGDEPLSPRDWLVGGGDVAAVTGLASTLGEQV